MSGFRVSPMPQLVEARDKDDDWTGTTSWEERKKRQNRLNQRAYRRRKANGPTQRWDISHRPRGTRQLQLAVNTLLAPVPAITPVGSISDHEAFLSWIEPPVLDPNDMLSAFTSAQLMRLASLSIVPNLQLTTRSGYSLALWFSRAIDRLNKVLFPLSSDHILTIVQYNNFRGLVMNLLLLGGTVDFCEDEGVFLPQSERKIPPQLAPTKLQQTVVHSGWIDIFPVPQVRDNIIRNLNTFDDDELCADVTGDTAAVLKDELTEVPEGEPILASNSPSEWDYRRWECPTTAGRKCFILWGDPWDAEGWEATPGFIDKWSWIIADCPGVIRTTNRWRALRGEEPIVLEV